VYEYIERYQVLICKEHKQGVRGKFNRHLCDSHNLRIKRRTPLLQKYGSLARPAPKDVQLPEHGGPPFKALGKPLDALLCDACTHISVSLDGMQKHSKDHGWRFSKENTTHWSHVKVQTFFGKGYQRYFIVKDEAVEVGDGTQDQESDLEDDEAAAEKQLVQEWAQKDKEREAKLAIAELETEKSDNTGWWNFVQWRPHIGGRNMRRIAHASRLPDRTDTHLRRAAEIVEKLIKGAVDGLSSLHDDTPHWLRTANATEKVESRPMVRLQNEESLDCYIAYFKRFICYCLRVHAARKERSSRTEGGRGRRGSIDDGRGSDGGFGDGSSDAFSDAFDNDIDNTIAANEETPLFVSSECGEDDRDERSSPTDDEPDDTMKDCCELAKFNPEQEELLEEMQELLESGDDEEVQIRKMLALSMSMIMQSLKGRDRFESPIVHFAAVLGIVEDEDRLRRGDEYSYMLAGFMYCVRVLFVEHTLPASTRGEQTAADIDRFLELRKKYLVVGSYSPCSFIIKMLGYGKTMSMQKINQPSITWTRSETNRPDGDILEFHGKPLPIRRFKEGIHDMIREAEDILWEDLMWVSKKKERFEIDLDKIQDDLSFAKRGASWVTNEVNGLKDKRQWMIRRMLRAPKDKQLLDKEKKTWRMTKVREYMQLVKRLRELMLGLGHTGVGPPGRGEEVAPIRFRNGLLRERNIYIIGGRVVYVTRYHKSQALFGEAKVIPRFLPWRAGQIVAIFLAYVQPFEEKLNADTNGLPVSDHLWHDKNGPWRCEHLTKVLKQETAIRMGLQMTTNDYRHVAVDMGREYIGAEFMRDLPHTDEMPEEGTDVVLLILEPPIQRI
jgi:hypothetical protein